MAAPLGNKFWLLRSTHGRAPIFATPQDLWEAAVEYFEWAEQNPLLEDRVFSTKDEGVFHEPIAKMRAMTLDGLQLFLDIGNKTWFDYVHRPDYKSTCETIEKVIRSQKFSGAAAGLLNPVIIARDLGLVDKVDGQVTLNKGSGWDEVFAEVGNQTRALTKKKEPVTIEHVAKPQGALAKLN